MSTAVAEVRPAYDFPGSGKKSGGEHEVLSVGKRRSDGFFIEENEVEEEVLTENSSFGAPSPSSSSIGENSSSEAGGDEGEEEVESKLKEGDGLGCLDALEDSLPIKSGLSSFYSGKSKSFTSLAEATSTVAAAKELAKPENPFNKRRRILANWSRRASCSSLATATYLPPLLAPDHAVAEGNEGEEDDSDDDYEYNHLPHRGKNGSNASALPLPLPRLGAHTQMGLVRSGYGTLRSPRSFSLSDLQNSRDNSRSYSEFGHRNLDRWAEPEQLPPPHSIVGPSRSSLLRAPSPDSTSSTLEIGHGLVAASSTINRRAELDTSLVAVSSSLASSQRRDSFSTTP